MGLAEQSHTLCAVSQHAACGCFRLSKRGGWLLHHAICWTIQHVLWLLLCRWHSLLQWLCVCCRQAHGQPAQPKPIAARCSHSAVALDRQLMLFGGTKDSSLLTEPCVAEAVGVQVCNFSMTACNL
jgi:hypothetical protein